MYLAKKKLAPSMSMGRESGWDMLGAWMGALVRLTSVPGALRFGDLGETMTLPRRTDVAVCSIWQAFWMIRSDSSRNMISARSR